MWLVSNIRRAVNDRTTKGAMLVDGFRRPLSERGYTGQCAFVATHTDVLLRSEVAGNLALDEDATLEDAAAARNRFTKASAVPGSFSLEL